MKIFFGDLEYLSNDNYRTPIPLNAGCISSYLLKHMPVKIKMKLSQMIAKLDLI